MLLLENNKCKGEHNNIKKEKTVDLSFQWRSVDEVVCIGKLFMWKKATLMEIVQHFKVVVNIKKCFILLIKHTVGNQKNW